MIKFLATTIGVLITVVGFLYYLINSSNFLPTDINGNFLLINIGILFFLLFIITLCICILLIFCVRQVFFKQIDTVINIQTSIRYGILLSLGILVVYLLHFFHVLNFLWGVSILVVVILSLFVI